MATILITGCSSGIGAAFARGYLSRGDKVLATARNVDSLANLAESGCETFTLDVTDPASIQTLISEISTRHGKLDMLINNAGIAIMGPVADLPAEKIRHQLETNVIAPITLTQACLPLLRKSEQARVVNIGSISGIVTTPFAGAYCASKAALHSISDAMRMELKPFGIDVITVQPGGVTSSLGDNATAEIDDWLDDSSLYWPIRESIYERARAQQVGATDNDEFVVDMIKKIGSNKQPQIRGATHSTMLPLLKKLLPTSRLDALFSKRLGLDQMQIDNDNVK